MRVHPIITSSVLSVAAVMGVGCTKLVGVQLAVAEPCGQEQQALNGVQSFRMLSTGAEPDGRVAFTLSQPAGFSIGLGDNVVLSIEAYADNITASETPETPTVAPSAVGRSMPLTIEEGSLDIASRVLVGRIDSFGGPRDLDGNCTAMDSGEPSLTGRHAHTATFVPGVNKVLIFGGAVWNDGQETLLKSAEVFDPATGTFTALPAPAQARAYHTATALPDGRVVILGGFSLVNGQVAPIINGLVVDLRQDAPYVDDIILRTPRVHHTATLLADVGLIAVVGGCTGSANQGCTPQSAALNSTALTPSVEVINIATLTSTPAQGGLTTPRAMHQAAGFPSGNTGVIVIAGGLNSTGALRSIEFLQVSSGSLVNQFSQADALPTALVRHHMIAFNANQFVITGGQSSATGGTLSDAAAASSATLICSRVDNRASCTAGATMLGARFGHHTARLLDGTIVAIGGAVAPGGPTSEALRFSAGNVPPAWSATDRALPVARTNAAMTLLGGELGGGFVNQIFYSGGHTTLQPYETVDSVDIYFGK